MEENKQDEGRASVHKVVDDWLEDGNGRDLLLRRELGDENTEVIKCAPPHILEMSSSNGGLPPMPTASIRRVSHHSGSATFDKLVPENLRSRKTGLNVAFIADFNVAGQMTGLMRLLNEHTIHRARCIIINDDYLSYDRDVVVMTDGVNGVNEAAAIIEDADVYHFGRGLTPLLGIDWSTKIRPDNALVQYFGSEIRHLGAQIVDFHDRTGIVGLSAWDYTMLRPHPLFYHVNAFFDSRSVDQCDHDDPVVRICHATTNRAFKQSDVIREALLRVAAQVPNVEIELIEGKSHTECLEIKQRCHVTVDQISSGIYGLSAIESMAMGHAVLCGMSNFAMSYHPDCPVVPISDGPSLERKLLALLRDREAIRSIGDAGRAFVGRTANPLSVLRQHCWIYDLVVSGHRFATDPDEHMLVAAEPEDAWLP